MKEILLTQGMVALVDDEDFEYLSQWKWYADKKSQTFYAVRYTKLSRVNGKRKRIKISMHRLILNTSPTDTSDHANGNGLDNRRINLRICTDAQNNMNRGLSKSNTSGFKGVCWDKQYRMWRAQIHINKTRIRIGRFEDKEKAAIAYNEAAIKYHGEFARLNDV